MGVKDGLNAEQVAAARRREAQAIERQRWAELFHTYERCVDIARKVWRTQTGLADLHDNAVFLKEVAATLLISADRRNLTVQFREPDAPQEPQTPAGIEAASGTDEGEVDAQAAEVTPA